MTTEASGSLVEHDAASSELTSKIRWPLAYSLQHPPQQQGQQSLGHGSNRPARKTWWSHTLYKGPANEPVQILYSKTLEDSEKYARLFLEEDVVGFDMEWPWNDWKRNDLQNKIGLIQVATEDKIALFHIGLHVGKTVEQILAPSLRKLIEHSRIGKLGVGILNADFARLHKFFHLNPKGAVELSHLYRLVKYGAQKPELVSTKLVSLARLVEDELGYPLFKGGVRTSNWSKPLSRQQIDYAAGDAYAGYMLYHCMNYKRAQMTPPPPLPVHAESYLALTSKLTGVIPLRLGGRAKDGSIMTSEVFFGIAKDDQGRVPVKSNEGRSKEKSSPAKKATPKKTTTSPQTTRELRDEASQALYKKLVARRLSLAQEAKLPACRIATNAVLIELAIERPTSSDELIAIKGVGPVQQQSYGDAWLEVITKFIASGPGKTALPKDTVAQSLSAKPSLQALSLPKETEPSTVSITFATKKTTTPPQPRQLHTGLSFNMACTKLDEADADEGNASCYSDDSLGSLDFGEIMPQIVVVPELKRKRSESSCKDEAERGKEDARQQRRPDNSNNVAQPEAVTGNDAIGGQLRIARSKLQAFSRLVTRKMGPRRDEAGGDIVSERTLSLIIVRAPQTQEELERIPGIDRLILACQQTRMDLLKNVVKFLAPVVGDTNSGGGQAKA